MSGSLHAGPTTGTGIGRISEAEFVFNLVLFGLRAVRAFSVRLAVEAGNASDAVQLGFVPLPTRFGVHRLPEATGLRAILGQGSLSAFPVGQFALPGGNTTSGTLVAVPNDSGDLVAIRQDEQEWQPVKTGDTITHWIGFWKSAPPTPFDLQRPEVVDGSPLKLGDHEWLVPVVHPPLQSTLPFVMRMTGDGPTVHVAQQYRELQTESVRYFEWVASMGAKETPEEKAERLKQHPTPKYAELFGYCGRVLGVNYRVGLWELSALGMLDTNNGRDLVFYSLGLKQFLEQAEARPKA
jgi:hypothetical protein